MKMRSDKRIPRWLLAIVVSFVLIFSLTACMDLGSFNADDNYQEYYDSFGDVEGIFDGGSHSYDLEKSLFNAYSIEKLDWEDDDDRVAYEEYVYIVIPFEAALKIESVALFLNSEVATDLEISAFYFDGSATAPEKIKYKSSPDTEIIIVDEVETKVEIEYDDPDKSERIADALCYAKSDWGSFILENFSQPGYTDGYLHAGIDGLLYLRIENNSGLNKDMQSCSFNFNGLLIRSV